MNTPDEYCPFCSAPVVTRERRPNGNAVCAGGHTFALAKARVEPPVTDPLTYVLSSLRRAADNAYPWSLTPTEAGALVAEVERLREYARDLRVMVDGLETAAHEERAATVAWLREPGEYVDPACARLADCIERGVPRRKGEP